MSKRDKRVKPDKRETIDDELKHADEHTQKFSLNGQRHRAKVVKVYDADSVNIVFKHNGELIRWATRLYGVNAPEINGGSETEKLAAIVARDWVRSELLNKIVWVECMEFEKYGRLLCNIYYNKDFTGPTLSDKLIENGYAKPYMRS